MKRQYFYILIALCLGFAIPSQAQQKISGTLVNGGGVGADFILSQDGKTVVYQADQDTPNMAELYAVPANGSSKAIKISGNMPANADVDTGFILTKDAKKVFFKADIATDNSYAIYVVPVDGSTAPVKITPNLIAGGSVIDFILSDDEKTIIYRADQEVDSKFELYTIAADGSTPSNKISGGLTTGGDVGGIYVISKDGKIVIYRADQDTDNKFELYSVLTDGSASAIKISGNIVTGGAVVNNLFIISQDGTKVFYVADQDTDNKFELYMVSSDASVAPVKVNANLAADREGVGFHFILSEDETTIFYTADYDTKNVGELYSALTNNPASLTKLSTPMIAPKSGIIKPFSLTQDGKRIIYQADQDIDNVQELYTVLADGSASATKLNQNLAANLNVIEHKLSGDGTRVFYLADQDTDNIFELYSVPSDAAVAPIKINANLVANGNVFKGFKATNNGHTVIYLADQDTDGVFELYSTSGLAPLSNDDPNGATQLTVGTACNNILGNNTGARNSEIADPSIPVPSCGNYQGGDIWFSAIAPFSGDVKISLTAVSLNGITDLGMAVYTKNSGTFVLVDCATTNTSGSFIMPSITTAGFIASDTLFIRVWENGDNAFGAFNICIVDNNPDNDINPPTELTGKAVSATQIDLAWLDNSNNEAGFIVLRDGVEIETLNANTTTYSNTGLSANTFYNYKIRAFHATKNTNTNTLSIATLPLQPTVIDVIGTCEGGVAYIKLGNAPQGQNAVYRFYSSMTSGNLVGEISQGYFTTPILTQDTTFYAVVAIQGRESTPRIAIPIEVTKGIKAALVQGTDNIISCDAATEVEAVEEAGATYQWKKNGILLNETTRKLRISQSDTYQLIVKKSTCEVFFDFTVSLNYKPDANIKEGNAITFCNSGALNVENSTANTTYQWFKDGTLISSATSVTISESGTYTLEATEFTCINSSEIEVIILDIADNQKITASETKICPNGGTLDLSISAVAGLNYRWYKDDAVILNAEENTYQVSQVGVYQAEIYSVAGNCGKFSEKLTITAFDAPAVSLTNNDGTLSLDIPLAFETINWFTTGNRSLTQYQNEINITPGLGVYWAEITYLDGKCIVKSNSVQGSEAPPVGLENDDLENIVFEVFPNPSQDGIFYLKLSNFELNSQFELADALGRNLTIQIEQKNEILKLDLSQFSKGVYYLKAINQEGILIKKLIKE